MESWRQVFYRPWEEGVFAKDSPLTIADFSFPSITQYLHRRAVAGDAANRSAAHRCGAAEEHVCVRRFDPPRPDLRLILHEGPGEIAVENIALG